MNTPGFWREVAHGLLLSVAGAVFCSVLLAVAGGDFVLRGLVLALGAAQLGLLLHGLRARVGVVVTLTSWAFATTLLLAFDPALWTWIGVQVLALWPVRSLYRYDRLAPAIADAVLSAFAIAVAVAIARHTHSLFLTLWGFHLVLATTAFIPCATASSASSAFDPGSDDAFGQASRTAEAALRRLANRS